MMLGPIESKPALVPLAMMISFASASATADGGDCAEPSPAGATAASVSAMSAVRTDPAKPMDMLLFRSLYQFIANFANSCPASALAPPHHAHALRMGQNRGVGKPDE